MSWAPVPYTSIILVCEGVPGKGSGGGLTNNVCHGWNTVEGHAFWVFIYHAYSGASISFYRWGNWYSESWDDSIKIKEKQSWTWSPSRFPPEYCFLCNISSFLLSFIKSVGGWFYEASRDQGLSWLCVTPDTWLMVISCSVGPSPLPALSPLPAGLSVWSYWGLSKKKEGSSPYRKSTVTHKHLNSLSRARSHSLLPIVILPSLLLPSLSGGGHRTAFIFLSEWCYFNFRTSLFWLRIIDL